MHDIGVVVCAIVFTCVRAGEVVSLQNCNLVNRGPSSPFQAQTVCILLLFFCLMSGYIAFILLALPCPLRYHRPKISRARVSDTYADRRVSATPLGRSRSIFRVIAVRLLADSCRQLLSAANVLPLSLYHDRSLCIAPKRWCDLASVRVGTIVCLWFTSPYHAHIPASMGRAACGARHDSESISTNSAKERGSRGRFFMKKLAGGKGWWLDRQARPCSRLQATWTLAQRNVSRKSDSDS
jgi:hypothetical protein